jgi:tyrosyl-tRNA synthetase
MPTYGLEPQVVMTTPLLEGLDGVEKMSKSLGNYIGVTEPPAEMFGKVMSVSDALMWRYYLLLTDLTPAAIDQLKADVSSGARHPKQVKIELAMRIVTGFHSEDEARRAAAAFEARFSHGEIAEETLSEVRVAVTDGSIGLAKLIAEAGLASSSSEATRKIQQGGVKVDRVKVVDIKTRFESGRRTVMLEVGRRAVRVILD